MYKHAIEFKPGRINISQLYIDYSTMASPLCSLMSRSRSARTCGTAGMQTVPPKMLVAEVQQHCQEAGRCQRSVMSGSRASAEKGCETKVPTVKLQV